MKYYKFKHAIPFFVLRKWFYDNYEVMQQAKDFGDYIGLPEDVRIIDGDKVLEEYEKNTKFIMVIDPEIREYLEYKDKVEKRAKSEIVRDAVKEAIKKDRIYNEYKSGKTA